MRNILDFPEPVLPARDIVTLERNYRSTQPILAAANGVIDLAKERFTKNLWTERTSGERAASGHRPRRGRPGALHRRTHPGKPRGRDALKQQAVLFRTSSHSGPLEVELTRRNIPFVKFGGLKFLDAAHVKDMLALLRFVENPRDRVAGFRVLHLLPGIGPRPPQRVLDRIGERADPIAALGELKPPAARRRRLDGLRRSRSA